MSPSTNCNNRSLHHLAFEIKRLEINLTIWFIKIWSHLERDKKTETETAGFFRFPEAVRNTHERHDRLIGDTTLDKYFFFWKTFLKHFFLSFFRSHFEINSSLILSCGTAQMSIKTTKTNIFFIFHFVWATAQKSRLARKKRDKKDQLVKHVIFSFEIDTHTHYWLISFQILSVLPSLQHILSSFSVIHFLLSFFLSSLVFYFGQNSNLGNLWNRSLAWT